MKKTTFCVRIFDISPYVFTQILIERDHFIHNIIMHPPSTHSTYFSLTLISQKQEIPMGTRWMWDLIPHPTSSPYRNLSKKKGRYVENTNKKVVFFFSSSKL